MTGKMLESVLEALQLPPNQRQPEQLEQCSTYFGKTKFFRAVSRDSGQRDECIKHLILKGFDENQPVVMAGDEADHFFLVLTGSVRVVSAGSVVGCLEAGESFGESAVLGRTTEEQTHTKTFVADEEGTKLAGLSRAQYLHASGGFAAVVERIIKTPPMQRSQADIELLMSQFEETDFFASVHFPVLQRKCCKCMTAVVFRRGQKLDINPAQRFLCIVVSGSMTIAKNHKTVRTLKENDTLMGEQVVAEEGLLTASADGVMAVLSKQHYAAVTSEAISQIKQVLSRPPQKRSKKELEFSMDMFCDSWKTTPFFRALPSAVLRKSCCKMLGCREFSRGTTVFFEGDSADCLYIIIDGEVVLNGTLTQHTDRRLKTGCEFGHFDAQGGVSKDKVTGSQISNSRTATARVDSATLVVATLDKADFARLCQLDEVHIWHNRFWKLITTKEPSNDSELRTVFDEIDIDSSGELNRSEIYKLLDSLGRKPTQDQLDKFMARMDPDGSGEVDFEEFSTWWWEENATAQTSASSVGSPRPDLRTAFQSIDADGSGVVDYKELQEGLQKLQITTTKDDEAAVQVLLTEFDADGSGALDFEEFSALVKKLQTGKSQLAQLDSHSAPSSISHIKFEHYELLHSRIAASIMPEFTEDEAEASSRSDWQEDLQRFGNKDEQLDQQQFGHAMFQLVDEWCNGASSTQMIVGWLRMLFSNIVDVFGKLKKVSEIGCIEDELTNMADTQRKNDDAAKKEAEARFKQNATEQKAKEKQQSAAQAKAEKAKQAKEKKDKKEKARILKAQKAQQAAKKRAAKADKAAKLKAQEAGKAADRTNAASLESKEQSQTQNDIIDNEQTIRNLANEEAKLLRRLQSGELSPEEESAARARLKAIEAERSGLLTAAAAERDSKLAALDEEEAELLRRLESGELTPEEEAEVRQRLKAIATERAEIEAERSGLLAAAAAERDSKLAALDEEEAELLRRLESGELTPEEEAEVRQRLKAIATERAEVYAAYAAQASALGASGGRDMSPMEAAQLASQLQAFDHALSALDDEEAKLLRRLASGEMSPKEEAAVRLRLREIDAERRTIEQARYAALVAAGQIEMMGVDRKTAQLAAELLAVDAKLSVLDDEEAELLRRLASGELSPEDETAVKARLAEIASEREHLLKQREAVLKAQNDLKQKHAEEKRIKQVAQRKKAATMQKFAALDDEEAELRRKIASGKLTPTERAAAMDRLEAIAAERASIEAAVQAADKSRATASAIAQLEDDIRQLDDEMAALLCRLESGDCTPEEEAEIRARLTAIEAERAELVARRQSLVEEQAQVAAASRRARLEMQVIELKTQLAALDNEEADLLRRLAMGDLSPDEEAQIRSRLAMIAQERKKLQERLKSKQDAVQHEYASHKSNPTDAAQGDATTVDAFLPKLNQSDTQTEAEQAQVSQRAASTAAAAKAQKAREREQLWLAEKLAAKEAKLARWKERRRKEEILNAAKASGGQNYMTGGSTINMDMSNNVTGRVAGYCGVKPSEWYRWIDTANKLHEGNLTQLPAPQDDPGAERPRSHSSLQQQEQRTRQQRRLPRRSKPVSKQKQMMLQAKADRRRNATQYIASKIASETKVRVQKGFTLPALSTDQSVSDANSSAYVPRIFGHPSSSRGACRVIEPRARPPSFTVAFVQDQRLLTAGSPPSSPRMNVGEHPFDAYVNEQESGSVRNPNLNMGRSARGKTASSRAASTTW